MSFIQMQKRNLCGSISIVSATSLLSLPAIANEPGAQNVLMEEVIVSAQRRAESSQDVPISITALPKELLASAGIDSSRDLGLVTPGLVMDGVGAWVQPAIRGVTTTITATTEANVATYIDGVYQATQVGAFYEMPDIQQVEVLKGPQGTLFGRNSTGGAILIQTIAPSLDESFGHVAFGHSSFSTNTVKGFVSQPLVPGTLAVSLSGYYDKMDDGYLDDLYNGGKAGETETEILRGKIRYAPTDFMDLTLTAMYSNREDGTGLALSNWQGNNAQSEAAAEQGIPLADDPHELATDVNTIVNPKTQSVSLAAEFALPGGTLTSTTSYMENDLWMIIDGDGSPFQFSRALVDSDYEVFSQEMIFASEQFGPFRGIGGLYLYEKNAFQLYAVTTLDENGNWTNDDLALGVWTNDDVSAQAVFGELTADLTEQLSLTLGVRYSRERATAFAAINFDADIRPEIPELGSKTWDSIDPRVSLVYALSDDANVYASYSQGFKSGVFNNSGLQPEPVDPEDVDAYEIGFKGNISPSLKLEGAAFYYDYSDLQQTTIEFDEELMLLRQQLRNAASVDIKGLELNAQWSVNQNLHLIVGGQYLDAQFDQFPDAVVNIPESQSVIVPTAIDASGNDMIRAPEWTGSITGIFNLESSIGPIDFASTLYSSSGYYLDAGNRVEQPGYVKWNATINWRPFDQSLAVKLWGKNLTNSDTLVSIISSTAYDAVAYAPPRSYGLEVSYEF